VAETLQQHHRQTTESSFAFGRSGVVRNGNKVINHAQIIKRRFFALLLAWISPAMPTLPTAGEA
jgi:hypothetical protein